MVSGQLSDRAYLPDTKTHSKTPTYRLHEPKDRAENDDLCVKPLFLHRPCSSTDREKLRLPILLIALRRSLLEPDLDDEQIRALLASPLYLQEREASADRSQVYHSERDVKFISSSEGHGETRCVVFKQKEVESRSIFRQRRFSSTACGKQRTLIQILSSGKFCQIILGGKNVEITCLQKQSLKS